MLLLLTALAACARLITLDDQSLWLDEFLTFNEGKALATDGLLQIFAKNHVSPFYDLIVALLLKLNLQSEFWLRLPSALAGIASTPLAYLLAYRLFNSRGLGLAAAFILAVSPLAVWYAQEARSYSLLLMFSMLFVYLSWPAVGSRLTVKNWLALTICTVSGFYVHPYIAMTAATFAVFLLVVRGIRSQVFWGWVSTQLVALIFILPWLYIVLRNDPGLSAGSPKPLMVMWIPYTLFSFVGGFSLGPTVTELRAADIVTPLLNHIPLFVVGSLASIGAFYYGFRQALRRNRVAALWCLTWLFIPIILVMAVTLMNGVNYNVRYVIVSYPALVMIVAGALVAATRRPTLPALASISVLLFLTFWSLTNWYVNPRYAKPDIRAAANVLKEIDANEAHWFISHGVICDFLPYYQLVCPDSAILINNDDATLQDAVAALDNLSMFDNRPFYLLEYRTQDSDPSGVLRREFQDKGEIVTQQSWGLELSLTKFRIERSTEIYK